MGQLFNRLEQSGVSIERMRHIMRTHKRIRKPLLRGLPEKTVRRVLDHFSPYTSRGSKSCSDLGDACSSC